MTALQAILSLLVEHAFGQNSAELQELGEMLQDIQGGIPWWLRTFEGFKNADFPAPAKPDDPSSLAKQISRARLLATVPPGFTIGGMLSPTPIVGSSCYPKSLRFRRGSTPPDLWLQEPTPASTQLTIVQTQDPNFLAVPDAGTSSPHISPSRPESPDASDEVDELDDAQYVPSSRKRAAPRSPPVKRRKAKRSRDD